MKPEISVRRSSSVAVAIIRIIIRTRGFTLAITTAFLATAYSKLAWCKPMTAEEFLQTLNELTVTNNLSYPDIVSKKLSAVLDKDFDVVDKGFLNEQKSRILEQRNIGLKLNIVLNNIKNGTSNITAKYVSSHSWIVENGVRLPNVESISGEIHLIFPPEICVRPEELDNIFTEAERNTTRLLHPVGGGRFYGSNQKGQRYTIAYGDNPNSAWDFISKVQPVEHCVTGFSIIIDRGI